jgi:hypothetical protein
VRKFPPPADSHFWVAPLLAAQRPADILGKGAFVKIRARFVAVVAVIAVLAIGGVAFAYWTLGGSGSGNTTAGTGSTITVNQTGTPTGLFPGGPAAALAGTFTNPNPGSVNITSVTAAVRAFTSHLVDAAKPDCTQADFAIGGTSGANVVVSGTNVGAWSGLTVRLLDNGLNQDNCKGVSITIDYTANP